MFEARDRVYLDSNVLIYLIEAPRPWGAAAKALVEAASAMDARLVTSELSIAECCMKPRREGSPRLEARYHALFESGAELSRVPLDWEMMKMVPGIAAECGLKLVDAIHVASAVTAGCGVFVTNDTRLRVPAPMRLHRLAPA